MAGLLLGGAAIYAGSLLGPSALVTSTALALVLVLAAAAVTRRQPGRTWQLQANYHGRATLIYSSEDVRVFNQVARALLRAIEDAERRDASNLRTAAA
jgi:hypothetical protein